MHWHNTYSAFMKHRPWILTSVGSMTSMYGLGSQYHYYIVWLSESCKIHLLKIKCLKSNWQWLKIAKFSYSNSSILLMWQILLLLKWFKNLKHFYISLYSKLYIQKNTICIFMLCCRCWLEQFLFKCRLLL